MTTTLQLVSDARRALVEARTLPDFRKVMEAAAVAADAAKRAAKLMEAQGMAAEVVEAANEAANEAAAVRIEAQAGAGRILREMKENGERRSPGYQPGNADKPSLQELLGGANRLTVQMQASRWQRVAEIPDKTRADYVAETVEKGGEITTAGLLRYAATSDEEPADTEGVLASAYDTVAAAMTTLVKYRGGAIAAYASETRRRARFRELVARTRAWIDEAEQVLR